MWEIYCLITKRVANTSRASRAYNQQVWTNNPNRFVCMHGILCRSRNSLSTRASKPAVFNKYWFLTFDTLSCDYRLHALEHYCISIIRNISISLCFPSHSASICRESCYRQFRSYKFLNSRKFIRSDRKIGSIISIRHIVRRARIIRPKTRKLHYTKRHIKASRSCHEK